MGDAGIPEPPSEEKSVSIEKIGRAIHESEERSAEFWREMKEEGKDTFERSLENLSETKNTIIDFIKIVILIASVLAAGFQYFLDELTVVQQKLMFFPFLFLITTMFILILGFFDLWKQKGGTSSGNLYQTIDNSYDKKEYYRIMSAVYFKWSDNNIDINQKVTRKISYSVVTIFASLSSAAAILIFV